MNQAQQHWIHQARSDSFIFSHLRCEGMAVCHLLHYLQMSTEKLSKAYFWRQNIAPRRSHTGLPEFFRALADRASDKNQIADSLGFQRSQALNEWIRSVMPLAHALQSLAPALANDGPNPEYPWPHDQPTKDPDNYPFPLWRELAETGRGRMLLVMIARALERFDRYA